MNDQPTTVEAALRTADPAAGALVRELTLRKKRIALAESCTGGLAAALLTSIAGASNVFDCGIVSYANAIKTSLLDVNPATLELHGAVSAKTAGQMAIGILDISGADVGIAITGIAGPSGGTPEKPVGLVWFGLALRGASAAVETYRMVFSGNRDEIRLSAARFALDLAHRAVATDGLSAKRLGQ